ncbi:hypothetical protein V1505DRAFT_402092 [Lipomyces doorenjongii]
MGPPRAILLPALLLMLIISFNDTVDLKSATHQESLAKHALNSSLGFGEIVYISMPDRTDRQDAMTLLASSFGIKLKLIPGVRGSEMSPKAMPDGLYRKTRPSELGCWRAHVNAWRHLLDSDMDTLLIFEDDLDWNTNLKKTMETLSLQMQNSKIRLSEPSDYELANAPYGLDWDVLDIGSCKDSGHPDFKDISQIWDDPDVPDIGVTKQNQLMYDSLHNFGLTDADIGKKRLLAPAYLTVCTSAYAITRQGAERLLMAMSYIGFRNAVDTDMSRAFREGRVRGYMLTPPAISQFRIGGSKDTDNRDPGDPRLGRSARKWMVDNMKLNNWEDYKRIKQEKLAEVAEESSLPARG